MLTPGVAHRLSLSSGTLALDGEREIEFAEHDTPMRLLAAIADLTLGRTPLDDVTALVVHRRPSVPSGA